MEKFNNWEIFNQCKNIDLNSSVKEQLQKFYEILITENQKYNLTRITEINDVFEKHFLDSLLFTNEEKLTSENIADIGTGPGFPGIVLKIFFPEIKLTLIESNTKKINFLKLVTKQLDLKNVNIVDQRAEVFSVENKEQFDVVVSRAVAYLDVILEIGVQMLKVNGLFILLKGPRAEEEINNSKGIDKKLNLELVKKQLLDDIGFGTRVNLFYKKINHTNSIYPRKYSTIKKESGLNGN